MIETISDFKGTTITVDLADRSYPIYVGSDIYELFGQAFQRHCPARRAVIVTDENVGPLYGQAVSHSLQSVGVETHLMAFGAGEASKRMAVAEVLYDKFFDLAIERADVVVALGGGVVGDLAGFIAATFKRGLNYVQVPTTLLAMVDSSVGGKTGINHTRGKNMIGAFHQPKLVFADVKALQTLEPRELGCGLAETVKHAVIRDGEFFGLLESKTQEIQRLAGEFMVELVARNCRIKAAVVTADECEAGLRGILNLGHTIGHTFETVLTNCDYHHGEAVSLGMVGAVRLALGRGLLDERSVSSIIKLLEAFGLPVSVDKKLPVDAMYKAMLQDKKVKAGKINFVLPTGIGSCTFANDLAESEIKTAIESLVCVG